MNKFEIFSKWVLVTIVIYIGICKTADWLAVNDNLRFVIKSEWTKADRNTSKKKKWIKFDNALWHNLNIITTNTSNTLHVNK